MAEIGRPTAITPERQDMIVRFVETVGASPEEACLLTGVTPRAFYVWQTEFIAIAQHARDAVAAGLPLPSLTAKQKRIEAFFMAVRGAQIRLKLRLQGAALKAALGQERIDPIYEDDGSGGQRLVRAGQEGRIGDWRAAVRILETVDVENWGRRIFTPTAEVESPEVYALNVPPPQHLLKGKVEVPRDPEAP